MSLAFTLVAVIPYTSIQSNAEEYENTLKIVGQNDKREIKQYSNYNSESRVKKEVYKYVYTIGRVNIRVDADKNSSILLCAEDGTKLLRTKENVIDGWDAVKIGEDEYYIANEYTTEFQPGVTTKSAEEQLGYENNISEEDLKLMSAIIFSEAGNQCEAGKQAVGIVVMNRVRDEKFEDTIKDVIYETGQFTPITDGHYDKALSMYDAGTLPDSSIEAAKYALSGNSSVCYNQIVYNLEGYLFFSRWLSDCRLKIQDHMFK